MLRHKPRLICMLVVASCCGASLASVWPKPLQEETTDRRFFLVQGDFKWRVNGFDSEILQEALERYDAILFGDDNEADITYSDEEDLDHKKKHHDRVRALNVYVASNDQSLNLQTDEGYVLEIAVPRSSLSANTVFGALHGLETFSQLMRAHDDTETATDSASNTAVLIECKEEVNQETTVSAEPATSPAGLQRDPDEAKAEVEEQDTDADPEPDGEAADGDSNDDDELEKHKKKKKKKKKHKKHKKKHHKKHHKKEKRLYSVNGTSIWDAPRFAHRGLLIDTARHFLPVPIILEHLEAMSYSKLNVLHWHIVDDQSFPFVSERLPLLAQKGAFSPELTYSPSDVQEVVTYAKNLGIRVIPEFDTPGHTLSWGLGHPEILADCYSKEGKPLGTKGPMNPARNTTYELLWGLLMEVATVFPDLYVHLGGDEVPFDCWKYNPEIIKWMAAQNPSIKSMAGLEEYFERRVLDLAAATGRSYIVWQEILDNNVQVQEDTVVHVWKWWWPTDGPPTPLGESGHPKLLQKGFKAYSSLRKRIAALLGWLPDSAETEIHKHLAPRSCRLSSGCQPRQSSGAEAPSWTKELQRVTKKGYRTLLSSPWYLNLGGFASSDWTIYYSVEPQGFNGTKEERNLVIGGEACMWGEFVDETNSISRTWPRAAAVAERLWSDSSVRSIEEAWPRLSEHRCRLNARGIGAEPLGPGYCQ